MSETFHLTVTKNTDGTYTVKDDTADLLNKYENLPKNTKTPFLSKLNPFSKKEQSSSNELNPGFGVGPQDVSYGGKNTKRRRNKTTKRRLRKTVRK
jgi:hypothetical protein